MLIRSERSDIGLHVGVVYGPKDDPDTGKIVARNKDFEALCDEIEARHDEFERKYPGKVVVLDYVPEPGMTLVPVVMSGSGDA